MNDHFPAENTIRDYLLGRLDDQADLEQSWSEWILVDDELSETVSVIEDEIIEDYLDGRLDAASKRDVEQHFLRPPARQEKLKIANRLRLYYQTKDQD